MGEGVILPARQHPAEQASLPLPEDQRFAGGASDGVFGDGDQFLSEVRDDVAQAASQVSRGNRGQPARWPAFAARRSRYLSTLLWLSTIAIPSLARSAGVSPK